MRMMVRVRGEVKVSSLRNKNIPCGEGISNGCTRFLKSVTVLRPMPCICIEHCLRSNFNQHSPPGLALLLVLGQVLVGDVGPVRQ